MRAILVKSPGGPEQLVLGAYRRPSPSAGQVLVQVGATALNRADLMQRAGKYPPPPGSSPLLGLEVAGTIIEKGSEVSGWQLGERVCGLLDGGGYAEYAVIHQDLLLPIPDAWSVEQAAAIPEVFLTAFQALYWHAALKENDTVLIHAGASGVGTAALQMVRANGNPCVATASASKHEVCYRWGADKVIDYQSTDFAEHVLAWTDGKGVDVIVDFVGGPYLKQNIKSMALDGRLIMLAMLGGYHVEALSLIPLFRKRLQVIASTLRNRSLEYKGRLVQAFREAMWPKLVDGLLEPVIDSVYPWQDVQAAHQRMEANLNTGKIILRVTD